MSESELVQCLYCDDYFPDHDEWYDHLQMLHETESEYADLVGEAIEFFDLQLQEGMTPEEIRTMIMSVDNLEAAEEIVKLFDTYYYQVYGEH